MHSSPIAGDTIEYSVIVRTHQTLCIASSSNYVAFVGARHDRGSKAVTGATMLQGKRRPRNELRDKSQIVKERAKRAAKKSYQQHRTEQRRKRKGVKSRIQRKH